MKTTKKQYQNLYKKLLKFSKLNTTQRALNIRKRIEGQGFPIILKSPLKKPDDLIRIIHMVYAWMPKMIVSFEDGIKAISKGTLYKLAKEARSGKISEEKERNLLVNLASLTNNHIVGASKVLMIINQKRYPILDSRVIRNWKIFFKKNPFPDIPVINNPSIKDNKAMVKNYIEYQKAIQMFAKGAGRSLRDIEFLFYYAGKKSFR
jgi:hypothetical protein